MYDNTNIYYGIRTRADSCRTRFHLVPYTVCMCDPAPVCCVTSGSKYVEDWAASSCRATQLAAGDVQGAAGRPSAPRQTPGRAGAAAPPHGEESGATRGVALETTPRKRKEKRSRRPTPGEGLARTDRFPRFLSPRHTPPPHPLPPLPRTPRGSRRGGAQESGSA